MFTGIIEELASVHSLSRNNDSARLAIESKICGSDCRIGDSISINGCCLTVSEINGRYLFFDISRETLQASDLADLAQGDKVNLERSLKQGSRIGGHFVTGHIDYAARLLSRSKKSDFVQLTISIERYCSGFLARKGSVAIDGISLTVNEVGESSFNVMIIPFTLSNTTLQYKEKGCRLNVETDILAKYTHSFLRNTSRGVFSGSDVDKLFLSENGFI
ncbi:MAG: riboflavin synthase [Candidatus Omnitrophica bacterium]|jgi:riboflavin synthase|nr:riboflavin synthase [Candidatus Omnitrophota bacterium]